MSKADLTFLYGQHVPRCTHDVDKHFDDYQTVQYMTGGCVDLTVGESHYLLKGRWFWSCYPGPRIQFHVADGFASWQHRYFAFRGPLVGRWTAEGLFPIHPQRPPGSRDYGRRFDELLELSARTDRWGVARAVHVLEGILIELAEDRAQPPLGQAWLEQTIDALGNCVGGEAPNYPEMAAKLGMSESGFRRRFRRATGVPPHVYLLQCRAAAARRLLAETEMPIKSIARELGYSDVFFFTRQFRKLIGVPPALYRKSRQG